VPIKQADIAAQHARLAALGDALTRLRAQYDVLMNAFKFDEARAVAVRIEAREREQQALAATLPPPPEPTSPMPYTLARRRRVRR
jgi:hypothetical protein